MNYISQYLEQGVQIFHSLDREAIERTLDLLLEVRCQKGRIFFLGVGGGAGNASHAVNDFRKIAGIECYAPTDNVSRELTARINDDGVGHCLSQLVAGSQLRDQDAVFVFSVGGGGRRAQYQLEVLVSALQYAMQVGARSAASWDETAVSLRASPTLALLSPR